MNFPFKYVKYKLLSKAANLHLSFLGSLGFCVFLLIAGSFVQSRTAFLIVGLIVGICVLSFNLAASVLEPTKIDSRIASWLNGFGVILPKVENLHLSTLWALAYGLGAIGIVWGYGYLALTKSELIIGGDEVLRWSRIDKRPLVFGYVMAAVVVAFHRFMMEFAIGPRSVGRLVAENITSVPGSQSKARSRLAFKALSAVLVAFLAYSWICLPALRILAADDGTLERRFYEFHSMVHLGAMEQIRLGAMPYIEAQTQYGLGNQVLLYALSVAINYSNHGFYAANILLNVCCVIVFFALVGWMLGAGWGTVGVIGWTVWPSPAHVIGFGGWAIFSRWLAIPVLSLLLARMLCHPRYREQNWLGASVAGAIWGGGSYLSQENLSGGILVLALSLALFCGVSRMPVISLVRFASLFIGSGALTFAVFTTSVVGYSNFLDVLRLASAKSGLVLAGISNTWWSDDLNMSGQIGLFAQTYGFAVLLVIAIGLLGRSLGEYWRSRSPDKGDQFFAKFSGVVIGAYVMHQFTLLRADAPHLNGPSFLLPLFLAMLPVFALRSLPGGRVRGALVVISVSIVGSAVLTNKLAIRGMIEAIGAVVSDTQQAIDSYHELMGSQGTGGDFAKRYSPIAKHQIILRNYKDFTETEEFFALLRARLEGRKVEWASSRVNALIDSPEKFYFFGGFRSVSGITSRATNLWLRSEEDAWINRVVSSADACVLFDAEPTGRLYSAWSEAVGPQQKVITEKIAGARTYATLSCRG